MTTTTLTKVHPVATALLAIQEEMSAFFKERRSCIQGITLSLLTGQHCFILGQPGTGKTFLVKSYFGRFVEAEFFEVLLSKNLPPEAVLGPWDIPKLRNDGDMNRKIKGFLPTADLAMIDEVGKMSASVGHSMLAVLNERVLHQVSDGRSTINVPLSTAAGGSNEMPTDESDDAAALWDRLLVRMVVKPIQETGNFIDFFDGPEAPLAGTTIAWADMIDVITNVVPAVVVPSDVKLVVARLRESIKAAHIDISDRRWKQCKQLLQANAFLAGRTEVMAEDVEVLRHALWTTPSEIPQVERLTLAVSNPIAEKALAVLEKAEEIAQEVRDSKGLALDKRARIGVDLGGRLKVLLVELDAMRATAVNSGASATKINEVYERVEGIKSSAYLDLLEIDTSKLP